MQPKDTDMPNNLLVNFVLQYFFLTYYKLEKPKLKKWHSCNFDDSVVSLHLQAYFIDYCPGHNSETPLKNTVLPNPHCQVESELCFGM